MKKYSEILNINPYEMEKRSIIDESPFIDIRKYLNLEKIIRSEIQEFDTASDSVVKKFFEKAIELYTVFMFDEEEGIQQIDDWDLSEGIGSKGFFGTADSSAAGKALGLTKKKNVVMAIGKKLKKAFDVASRGDFNSARMFNFFPSATQYIGLDNYSDLLIKVLSSEFEKYTKRMIVELKVDKQYISNNGLLLVSDYLDGKIVQKEEYFYPDEFLSSIPIVTDRDYNAMVSMRAELKNASKAFRDIFEKQKNKKIDELEEISESDISFIREIIDFRYFSSFFANNYRSQKTEIISAFKALPTLKAATTLETIKNTLKVLDDIKIYYSEKDGVIQIAEEHVDDLIFAMLSMIYADKNARRQYHQKSIGTFDIAIKDGDINTLIELKKLTDPHKISGIVKNYHSQMERYNTAEPFDQNIYVIFVANLGAAKLNELVSQLDEINLNSKINKTYIILATNHVFSGSDKSSQAIIKRTQIIMEASDIDKHILETDYVKKALELKARIYEVSGVQAKLVDLETLKERLESCEAELEFYFKKYGNDDNRHYNIKQFKEYEALINSEKP